MISTKMNLGVQQLQNCYHRLNNIFNYPASPYFFVLPYSSDFVSRLVSLWLQGDCQSSALMFSKDIVQWSEVEKCMSREVQGLQFNTTWRLKNQPTTFPRMWQKTWLMSAYLTFVLERLSLLFFIINNSALCSKIISILEGYSLYKFLKW